MNSKVQKKQVSEVSFPCLAGIQGKLIVLFVRNHCGTVVHPCGSWSLGVYYTEWKDISEWEILKDEVVLSN